MDYAILYLIFISADYNWYYFQWTDMTYITYIFNFIVHDLEACCTRLICDLEYEGKYL